MKTMKSFQTFSVFLTILGLLVIMNTGFAQTPKKAPAANPPKVQKPVSPTTTAKPQPKQKEVVKKEVAAPVNDMWIICSNSYNWLYDSVSGKIYPLRGNLWNIKINFSIECISPDGKYLFTYESHRGKNTIFLYEIATGQLKHRFKNHNVASFSPDGQWLIVGEDRDCLQYNISIREDDDLQYNMSITGEIEKEWIRNDGQNNKEKVIFSPDKEFVLREYYDKEEGETLWGLYAATATDGFEFEGEPEHKFKGYVPIFSPNGKLLATRYDNNNFKSRLYNTTTGQRKEQFTDRSAFRYVLSEKQTKFLQVLEGVYGKEKIQQDFGKSFSIERGRMCIEADHNNLAYDENIERVSLGQLGCIIPLSSLPKYLKNKENYHNNLFWKHQEQVRLQIQKEQDEED